MHNLATTFEREGVSILRNLIDASAIEEIRDVFDRIATPSPLGFPARYKRISYSMEDHTDLFQRLTASEDFAETVYRVTGRRFILTQVLGLETEPAAESGVKWHYDQTSYGYFSVDYASFGLWLPLVEISAAEQRGGISWVPKNVLSAREKLRRWESFYHRLYDLRAESGPALEALNQEFGYTTEYGLDWLSDDDERLLNEHEVEVDFPVGDAVMMDRDVYHRTTPFLEGPIKTRLACVLRFVDAEAVLDRKLFEGLGVHARIEQRILPRIFISKLLDLPHGAPLVSSRHCPTPFPA